MKKIILHSYCAIFTLIFSINSPADTTSRASVSDNGSQSDGYNYSAVVSGNGSAVAFVSDATNLVAGDTNGASDIFVHDMSQNTTTRVSVSSSGEQANGLSVNPAISHDGRYVVFESNASNLVADDTNNTTDIFLHDRVSGTTERINISPLGQTLFDSHSPTISADGRYVVYYSFADNLVAGDTNNSDDIFVYDRIQNITERITVNAAGEQANGSSYFPQISPNGRYITFYSLADNLVAADTNGMFDVFLYDSIDQSIENISVNSNGQQANNHSFASSVSDSGRYVVFESDASNLATGDTNRRTDVFLRDRVTQTTARISLKSDGTQAMGASRSPKIAADQSYVAFSSQVDLLVGTDINGREDVYAYKIGDGSLEIISVDTDGNLGNYNSSQPSINADGRFIAFQSTATNLVAGDSNAQDDIFVRTRGPVNLPPVAKAGQDVSVYLGQPVNLDGTASFDPDGDPIVSYVWRLELTPPGSNAALASTDTANSSLSPDMVGDYVVSLVVSDGTDISLADEIFIHVIENLPPVAVLSASTLAGSVPLTVQFSGSGSTDPENSPLAYHWDFGMPGATSDLADPSFTFTAPGTYTVVLTVQDNFGNIAETAVDINVTASNQPPTINPYTATSAQGQAPLSVAFVANATDPDGDVLSYYWDFGDGFNSSDENPVHVFVDPGSYTVTVSVSDGEFTRSAQLFVSVQSPLNIHVGEAEMDWERHGGKLKLGIQFSYRETLLPSDVIRVNFADLALIKATLAEFENQDPGIYVYKNRHVYVKLDLNEGYLKVSHRLKSCKGIQTGQAVPVMVKFGNTMGVDQIILNAEDKEDDRRWSRRKHASYHN